MSLPLPSMEEVREHARACRARALSYDGAGVWIHLASEEELEAQLRHLQHLQEHRGARDLPLTGLVAAVKDNIDVAGMPTTSACPAYAYVPSQHSGVVRKLTDAGAIVLGKTNMDQFATGLVGTRSPYGACQNHFNRKYISGGSSSGSAVAVAAEMCDFSLGTDTAGSGRVPAAFNHLIGLKPTKGLLSTTGVVPACRSLDCVSIFARDCDLAGRVLKVAEGFDPGDAYSRSRTEIHAAAIPREMRSLRVGVPDQSELEFFGNDEARTLYRRAVARLSGLGASVRTVCYEPFRQTAELLYEGPWVAERLAALEEFVELHGEKMLEVTRTIIGGAAKLSATETFRGMYRLEHLRRVTQREWGSMDVLVLPTTGTVYTIEQVQADPIALNRNLGYYTNFVNLLDLCAVALPAGTLSCGVPWGITLMAPAGNDEALLALGRQFCAEETGERA